MKNLLLAILILTTSNAFAGTCVGPFEVIAYTSRNSEKLDRCFHKTEVLRVFTNMGWAENYAESIYRTQHDFPINAPASSSLYRGCNRSYSNPTSLMVKKIIIWGHDTVSGNACIIKRVGILDPRRWGEFLIPQL